MKSEGHLSVLDEVTEQKFSSVNVIGRDYLQDLDVDRKGILT
jgi:hypothetical protein